LYWGKDGKSKKPRLKKFLSEAGDVVPRTIWDYGDVGHTQEAKREIMALADSEIFATPKPERLLQRILHIGSDKGDLVVDFFVGSGTTAAVAHKMNRKYVGVEQLDYIETITIPRLQMVIEGEKGGISNDMGWQGGGSVVVCELAKWNARYVDRIQAAQSASELQML
jgi:adenine-specific DNA-methyltransferase